MMQSVVYLGVAAISSTKLACDYPNLDEAINEQKEINLDLENRIKEIESKEG